ncbi:hypothetical protein [Nocardia sp. R6R-6]|uniref:hypothetical protein n=1 Tax=Nocardia sp. R6R-6 TaxID=3459303 RepID=UPI00403D8323
MTRQRTMAESLVAVAALVALAGCGTHTGEPTSVPTSASTRQCYPSGPLSDPLGPFVAHLELPAGVKVISGLVVASNRGPNLDVVTLELCVPGSEDPDSLRPIATEIADALKRSELGARTAVLNIADKDVNFREEAKLRDGDFQDHPWNGTPSREAELQLWTVVTG